MPTARRIRRKTRNRRSIRSRLTRWLPAAQTRRRWWRRYSSAPLAVRVVVATLSIALVCLSVNWVYQVIRKPSELFFPVSGTLYKTPHETWETYGPIFRRHATATVSAELLAALAQVEGSGNPIVRTYWRWSLSAEPFEMYRPASSAVGMYQITNGTFAEARRYCIHDHVVVEDGPWHDWRSCWFNSLYSRVVPSHAVELTSAYLDRRITEILSRHHITRATQRQRQDLAAVIHLCGAGAGNRFARRGFESRAVRQCGDHHVRTYTARIEVMRRTFARLAAED